VLTIRAQNKRNGTVNLGDIMSAIFEQKCVELEIDYEIETVKKYDPKSKQVVWSNDVAFPLNSNGWIKLVGDESVTAMCIDKTKIMLRSQNDPRKPEKTFTIDGVKITVDEMREFLASKRDGS
jgi:hypothetical protein